MMALSKAAMLPFFLPLLAIASPVENLHSRANSTAITTATGTAVNASLVSGATATATATLVGTTTRLYSLSSSVSTNATGTTAAATATATTHPVSSGSASTNATVSISSGETTDLGWIPTAALATPATLFSTNLNRITPTATATGVRGGDPNYLGGNYSSSALESLWDKWVGAVRQPPITVVPSPPSPYPLPNSPPPLFPDFYSPAYSDMLPGYSYPEGFLFGFATAAQQYEGAVKADGKGPSIWDWGARYPGFIADNTTSDVGDLGYYLYKEDLARLAALGGNVYSFSTFWTRIYPFAAKGSPVNQAGLDFYQDLIDYAWSLGVEPVLTLFHWDTPLTLQLKYGGFASDNIVDDYVNYAETMFRQYNGSIHKWITFNEPVVFCSQMAFPVNSTLPMGMNSTTYPYTCSYHLVLAHAKTVQRFRELNIAGEIAFKSDNFIGVPWRNNSAEDQEAVKRHHAYQIGIFAEPIYNTGDWPELIKNDLPASILPRFSANQSAMIKGTADFFAIDGYRDGFVTDVPGGVAACVANISNPNWPVCNQVNFYDSSIGAWGIGDFADAAVPWLQNTWRFLRSFLAELVATYPTSGGIYLSEFGFAQPYENQQEFIYIVTEDSGRTAYFMSYMGELLKAINDDGTPVKGAFAWSLVDNFEWASGFSTRFGTQYVDYNSPTLQRTFKRSALALSEFWNAHRSS